jgi:tRNA threonylcarbamoyladenosine biosynthesis protein TsaE
MTLNIKTPEGLLSAAEKLLGYANDSRIFLFYGDMGAGKTTFIKAVCHTLGVGDIVSSPTFSIVNEYDSPAGPVFHFDFYRIKNETEALDLGYEEYFYSGNYCFIEWPEKISNLLPEHVINVNLKITGENERLLTFY